MHTSLFIVSIPTEEEERLLRRAKYQLLDESDIEEDDAKNSYRFPSYLSNDSLLASASSSMPTLQLSRTASDSTLLNSLRDDKDAATANMNENKDAKETIKTDSDADADTDSYTTVDSNVSKGDDNDSDSTSSSATDSELSDLPFKVSMATLVRNLLLEHDIHNDTWFADDMKNMQHIYFLSPSPEITEFLLKSLNRFGIGTFYDSRVVAMKCVYSRIAPTDENDASIEQNEKSAKEREAYLAFLSLLYSRLQAAVTVRAMRKNATISFDFIVLILCSAIIAAAGLLENMVLYMCACILITPFMGPIVATIFGTTILDKRLWALGWKSELIGLLIASMVGFVLGLIVGTFEAIHQSEPITQQILQLTNRSALWVGISVSIALGLAAAVGVMNEDMGSFIGVAITASLTPPAVNLGIMFALASIYKLFKLLPTKLNMIISTNIYSSDHAKELFYMALISMSVMICNILCVYIFGVLCIWLRERVANYGTLEELYLWRNTVRLARRFNLIGYEEDNAFMILQYSQLAHKYQASINYQLLRKVHHVERNKINICQALGDEHCHKNYSLLWRDYLPTHRFKHLYTSAICPHESMAKNFMSSPLSEQSTIPVMQPASHTIAEEDKQLLNKLQETINQLYIPRRNPRPELKLVSRKCLRRTNSTGELRSSCV